MKMMVLAFTLGILAMVSSANGIFDLGSGWSAPNTLPDVAHLQALSQRSSNPVPMSPSYINILYRWTGSDICKGLFVCDKPVKGKRLLKDCLPMARVCDGIKDCTNGADELHCDVQCKTDEYPCSDGKKCAKLCDGHWECVDGEDEKLCSKRCTCPVGNYQCKGEDKCIPLSQVCDGETNCKYEDDECSCEHCQCGPGQLKCAESRECVDPENICDNVEDCPLGDDEKECPAACACGPNQFLCPNSNICIMSHELCECRESEGRPISEGSFRFDHDCYDCPGQEDESQALCGAHTFRPLL